MLRTESIGLVVLLCAPARAQTTELVSVSSTGSAGNAGSKSPSMSADARYVAFTSTATNLVLPDANGVVDVFLRDRQAGTTELVSVDTAGAQAGAASDSPSVSADGAFVVFRSDASNLVAGDTNASSDVFLRDVLAATTSRVSLGPLGAQGNGGSHTPVISADGRFVAYQSAASNLVAGDTNLFNDVFVTDLLTSATEIVSVRSNGAQGNSFSISPAISADGRYVAFDSFSSNLVQGDSNGAFDVFVRDRQTGTTERVSVGTGGTQSDGDSGFSSISADGRFVAFGSFANNLVVPDTNGTLDVYVHDRVTHVTQRVSRGTTGVQGNNASGYVTSMSAGGRFLEFYSSASNLVTGDTNAFRDAFVRDLLTTRTEILSVDPSGAPSNGQTGWPSFNELLSLSADGRHAAFASLASNLVAGDTNGFEDVFLRDRGPIPDIAAFCFGDGSSRPCPCGNLGLPGRGCENSAGTGGAILTWTGSASLSADTLQLTSTGELATAASLFMQGDEAVSPLLFGDGLRCTGGVLKRMQSEPAAHGVSVYPDGTEPAISLRSASLGDPIQAGGLRYYQTWYRDDSAAFCPDPPGNTWNVSNGLAVAWGP